MCCLYGSFGLAGLGLLESNIQDEVRISLPFTSLYFLPLFHRRPFLYFNPPPLRFHFVSWQHDASKAKFNGVKYLLCGTMANICLTNIASATSAEYVMTLRHIMKDTTYYIMKWKNTYILLSHYYTYAINIHRNISNIKATFCKIKIN